MQIERTTFFSDGLRLQGAFFVPDGDSTERAPLVIPCSGFTGLMDIHPARFARTLTAAGMRCFGFDYRGFAESEGERGKVLLEEQVRDILHAIAFARRDPRVDGESIILLGWGMGAGLVIDAARMEPGIAGIIAANGFYDGARFQRFHRGAAGLARFIDEVAAERSERAASGESRFVDAFDLYPLDAGSRRYVDNTLRTFEHYETDQYAFELGESILRWRVESHAPHMMTPILIAHGDRNELHSPEEARSLFNAWGGPKKRYWIEGAAHTDFMHDDDPRYVALGGRIVEFVHATLAGALTT